MAIPEGATLRPKWFANDEVPMRISDAMTGVTITSAARSVLDDTTVGAMRTTLGLTGLANLAIPDSGSEAYLGDGGGTPAFVNGSGTYSPTRSAESNLDANVSPTTALWQRSGKSVTVSGQVSVNPTLTATVTSFELDLPVASNLAQVYDLSGVAFCGAISGMGAAISGSVANNTAVFSWVASDIGAQTFSYVYTYRIL